LAKWLPSFGSKQGDAPKTVLELLVIEGADAGQQFTVDGSEVRIGRGKPKTGQTGTILLRDKSVSALQATISAERNGTFITHNAAATNPTAVNNRRVKRHKIKPGDHIQMGLVKIEVRQRQGIALSGLFKLRDAATEPLEVAGAKTQVQEPGPESGNAATVQMDAATEADLSAPTLLEPRGAFVLVRGLPGQENEVFPLQLETTVVGRSARCDITLPEPGISRQHLRCEWQDEDLTVTHLSETNSTCVNGARITGEHRLRDGDEVQLADQVVIRFQRSEASREERPTLPPASAEAPQAAQAPGAAAQEAPGASSLHQHMEDKIERDRLIEEEFSVEGSFVDIDVVGSYKMKAEADRPAHIIVSFERFRSFVEGVIVEFGGQVLNSNGDELMCFFESTPEAVRSSSAIFQRLDHFNETQNVLASPFRFRIGVHTGRSLVDRERGVAYSAVLDTAGHLQKAAEVNGLLVSASTLSKLPEEYPFEPAGTLDHEGIETFRATAPIE
jgi:pSer/pThr/pTyr-binding forkhead associated (FHA) protein/class 3 adenylate cyclase